MPENRLMLKKRIDLLLLASQTFKLRLYTALIYSLFLSGIRIGLADFGHYINPNTEKEEPWENSSIGHYGPGTSRSTFKVPAVLNQGFKTTMWSRTAGLYA